ncbi:MAG: exonuclease domain-containing protein [Chloroflexi bacterium]|nr:exonuclease domain-containing protein [Chloroflexota bacterium]
MTKHTSVPLATLPIYVSLDIETTGLDPVKDSIIEIAAVKFNHQEVIEEFNSLVNPHRSLPLRIKNMCGIEQSEVDTASDLGSIAEELVSFLGIYPIVGHSVSFDLAFLAAKGIHLSNPVYDTYELAILFLPQVSDFSLATVSNSLGCKNAISHRALPDALSAKDVFIALTERIACLKVEDIIELERLASGTELCLESILPDIKRLKIKSAFNIQNNDVATINKEEAIFDKITPLTPVAVREELNIPELSDLLSAEGKLSGIFKGFEFRPQQVTMLEAVAKAFNIGQHLIVEAGTGTGKSLAYLLPAAFFAHRNNCHVVISTNTINLQEQLLRKDIPDLFKAAGLDIKAIQLKGRSNYLCRRRLAILKKAGEFTYEEKKLLIKLLVWLPQTETGDKTELNLDGDQSYAWTKVCAQGDNCLGLACLFNRKGVCFLYRNRNKAKGSHLIVVNHALLLSDIAGGNNILPEFKHLILDEAHHLEEEATDQFGFKINQRVLNDYLKQLSEDDSKRSSGLLYAIRDSLKTGSMLQVTRKEMLDLTNDIVSQISHCRLLISEFFSVLAQFTSEFTDNHDNYEFHLRIVPGIRSQAGWYKVEISWENLSVLFKDITNSLNTLYSRLEVFSGNSAIDDIQLDITSALHMGTDIFSHINDLVFSPQDDYIYWISLNNTGESTLSGAPLHVGKILQQKLYTNKDTVILTSATLSTAGNFEYIKERLGLEFVNELGLDSPFDYKSAALVYVPCDIPEPGKAGFHEALARILISLCKTSQGRALVLFTSYALLRNTYDAIKAPLEEDSIMVLGQGIDGSARRLLETFKTSPRTVLLGAASFWEGIDVVGETLSILVIVRLPFSVPSDPVFSARSEMFDNPFNQYAVPQAIIRFKQGFGRLIRSNTDRGAAIVLDRRIQSKNYGSLFIKSLPPATIVSGYSLDLPNTIKKWLKI